MNINPRTASLTQARAYLAQLIYNIAPDWTLYPADVSTPRITDDIPADAWKVSYVVDSWEGINCYAIPGGCLMTYSTSPLHDRHDGVESQLTGNHDTDVRIIAHVTKIQQILTKAGA